MQLAQQFVIDELVKRDVRTILADGVAPIRGHIAAGLAAEPALADLGIEVVAVRVAAVAPTTEIEKALQQPTREAIQQDADEATFRRRALAVESERAIAENELQSRIELARREEDLVAREGANARRRAEEDAAAAKVVAQAADERDALAATRQAATIDEVESARLRAEAERERIEATMGADVLLAVAARELAAQLGQIIEERHLHYEEVRASMIGAIPPAWRTASVQRDDLDRFLFAADDIVVVLGQDGLVANVAKYLDAQPVIGLNPEPERVPGVLVNQRPEAMADLCADVAAGRAEVEERTMVRAALDDGQELRALNEIYFGHRSHQSARYELAVGDVREDQSSSGLIVATGTGATGWSASINRGVGLDLPAPVAGELAWFVREGWASPATGVALTAGVLDTGESLTVTGRREGVVFGDGIEDDRLSVDWGQRVTIGAAAQHLQLIKR
jgi:NAD kinase